MKKINLFIVGIVAMFGVMFAVHAEPSATLQCDKSTIGIGESTNCYVTIQTDSAISDTVITLSSSKYLIVSSPVANSKAGWVADAEKTKTSTGEYAFKNTSGGTTSSQVFSFTVTLSEEAKKLSAEDDCGQICISAVTFNNGTATMGTILQGTGTCFAPTVREEECTENCDPKNPETGAFMNYLIILGVGVGAIAAILIVRRTSKFYRV